MDYDPRYVNYDGYGNMNNGMNNPNMSVNYPSPYNYDMYNPWSQQQQQRNRLNNRLNMMERRNQQYAENLAYYNNQGMNNMNMPNNNNAQYVLKGRPVSNFEEANAYIVDLDGTTFYFPNTNNGEIYTKQIGLDGNAIINVYKLVPRQAQNNQQDYSYMGGNAAPSQNPSESPEMNNTGFNTPIPVDNSKDIELLNQKVKNLEQYITELEREIKNHVQSNANDGTNVWQQSTGSTNDGTVSANNELTKSYGSNAIDVWQQSEDATSYERNAR